MTAQARTTAAVKVRVSGDMPGIASALRVMHDAAGTGGFEISGQTRPYPNRREPGYRVYVTLRFPPAEDTGHAGRRIAAKQIRRPAAPSPVKENPGKRHHPS